MKVLVTGVAGFIGMHCTKRLLERGDEVVGLDNLSSYYSVELKKVRLAELKHPGFSFTELDIAGDVKATYADTTALRAAVNFVPSTSLDAGLARFAAWFKSYHRFG
jgi:nucleoside-diphosphate-sugar epimerase